MLTFNRNFKKFISLFFNKSTKTFFIYRGQTFLSTKPFLRDDITFACDKKKFPSKCGKESLGLFIYI